MLGIPQLTVLGRATAAQGLAKLGWRQHVTRSRESSKTCASESKTRNFSIYLICLPRKYSYSSLYWHLQPLW